MCLADYLVYFTIHKCTEMSLNSFKHENQMLLKHKRYTEISRWKKQFATLPGAI